MSLIDRFDPEERAKEQINKLLLNPAVDEMDRIRFAAGFSNQRYKLGLPFRDPSELDKLLALHPAVMSVASAQMRAKWMRDHDNGTAKVDELKRQLASMDAILEWSEAAKKTFALERNDCSRLHKLKEAAKAGRIIGEDAESIDKQGALTRLEHTFIVRHDWRSAFEKAKEFGEDFRLPFDVCAFEFRISGRTLIAACADRDGGARFTVLAESGEYWYPLCSDGDLKRDMLGLTAAYIWDQIRCISIALDAEVAVQEVVRASLPLNEKRAKAGKPPLPDYRVVDLSRRHRLANPLAGSGTGARKRLHFRRGHWRHYETTKVWIKWCLVGNPDLGFIQKHYSL